MEGARDLGSDIKVLLLDVQSQLSVLDNKVTQLARRVEIAMGKINGVTHGVDNVIRAQRTQFRADSESQERKTRKDGGRDSRGDRDETRDAPAAPPPGWNPYAYWFPPIVLRSPQSTPPAPEALPTLPPPPPPPSFYRQACDGLLHERPQHDEGPRAPAAYLPELKSGLESQRESGRERRPERRREPRRETPEPQDERYRAKKTGLLLSDRSRSGSSARVARLDRPQMCRYDGLPGGCHRGAACNFQHRSPRRIKARSRSKSPAASRARQTNPSTCLSSSSSSSSPTRSDEPAAALRSVQPPTGAFEPESFIPMS